MSRRKPPRHGKGGRSLSPSTLQRSAPPARSMALPAGSPVVAEPVQSAAAAPSLVLLEGLAEIIWQDVPFAKKAGLAAKSFTSVDRLGLLPESTSWLDQVTQIQPNAPLDAGLIASPAVDAAAAIAVKECRHNDKPMQPMPGRRAETMRACAGPNQCGPGHRTRAQPMRAQDGPEPNQCTKCSQCNQCNQCNQCKPMLTRVGYRGSCRIVATHCS